MLELIINIMLNGIFYAGILFIMSAGLQIIYGVLGIINFAHAGAYMLGIYLTYGIIKSLPPQYHLLIWAAPIVAAIAVGLLGLLFERGLLRLIYHRDHLFQILVTAGVVYIVDDVVRYKWGGYSIGVAPMTASMVEIGGVVYPVYNLVIIGVALALAVGLWLLFQKTNIGRVIRATSHDEEMTRALGINISLVKAGTFLFGSAIAGLAGGLMLPVSGGWPGVGFEYLIMAFVVIALAGLGSVNGALITALLIGMVNSIGVQFFPKIELAIMFILMAVILTVRPSGLFGTSDH
jgi:branched-chain amino acid transport system permease protein